MYPQLIKEQISFGIYEIWKFDSSNNLYELIAHFYYICLWAHVWVCLCECVYVYMKDYVNKLLVQVSYMS